MFHCWALLHNNDNWRDGNDDPIQPKAKSSLVAQVNNTDNTDDDIDEVSNPNRNATPIIIANRPPGRRGEKDKQRNGETVMFKTTMGDHSKQR